MNPFDHSKPASKLLLLGEEHGETDYRSIDQQATDNAHDHCSMRNEVAVSKHGWHS
jgi:hypothetical protein